MAWWNITLWDKKYDRRIDRWVGIPMVVLLLAVLGWLYYESRSRQARSEAYWDEYLDQRDLLIDLLNDQGILLLGNPRMEGEDLVFFHAGAEVGLFWTDDEGWLPDSDAAGESGFPARVYPYRGRQADIWGEEALVVSKWLELPDLFVRFRAIIEEPEHLDEFSAALAELMASMEQAYIQGVHPEDRE